MFLISDLIDNVYQRSRSRRTTSKSYKRKGIERKELESYIINLSEDIACLWDVAHENHMIGTKRKWLTVKSMYRCKRNKVSDGTITYRGGQHLSRQDLFTHGKIYFTTRAKSISSRQNQFHNTAKSISPRGQNQFPEREINFITAKSILHTAQSTSQYHKINFTYDKIIFTHGKMSFTTARSFSFTKKYISPSQNNFG